MARGASVALCRVPGMVGGSLAKACWARGTPYAVQVIGDPARVVAGMRDAPTGLGRVLASDLRWVCRHAASANYVTRRQLQERYPPGTGVEPVGLSDIDLGPEAFVQAPNLREAGPLRLVATGKLEQTYKGIDILIEAVVVARNYVWMIKLVQHLDLTLKPKPYGFIL